MELTVLIADDETIPRNTLKEHLPWDRLGVAKVVLASDGQEAVEQARLYRPDIVISDVKMPHLNGLEVAAAVREFLPTCQFIFLSGYTDKEYFKGAIKLKAASYVEKPIDLEEVTAAIQDVVNVLRSAEASKPAYIFFRGENAASTPLNTREYTCEKSLLKQLEKNIQQNRQEETGSLLNAVYAGICESEGTSPDYARHIYRQIMMMFLRASENQNIQSIVAQAERLLYTEARQPTLRQLWDVLLRTAETYFSALQHPDLDLVGRVDRYLEENYQESALTVQGAAESLGFTYTYLCAAYKKGCGKTINQRLTEIRLQRAKELLTSTNRKLYEIANMVGYADGKYFVKVFSRETGLSPKQYRERRTYAK